MKLSDHKRDVTAIELGEWIGAKYGTPIPGFGDLNLKVRGRNNSDWRKLEAKLGAAIPAREARLGIEPKTSDRILGECIKQTCLLGWEGVEDENGNPVAYSPAQAAEIIDNPEYLSFRGAVLWAADLVGQQRAQASEEAAKN